MPSKAAEPVQVEYTPEFKRNLRALVRSTVTFVLTFSR